MKSEITAIDRKAAARTWNAPVFILIVLNAWSEADSFCCGNIPTTVARLSSEALIRRGGLLAMIEGCIFGAVAIMGVSYRVDRERKVLLASAEGPIHLPEARAHLLEKQKEKLLAYPELVDARKADLELSPADVRQIVSILQTLSRESPLGKTAVVVSTDLAYGMMRMLSILVEDYCSVSPFRNLDEANDWLGL